MAQQLLSIPILLLLPLCFGTPTEQQPSVEASNNNRGNFMTANSKKEIKMLTHEKEDNTDAVYTDIGRLDTYYGMVGNDVLDQSQTDYFGADSSAEHDTLVTIVRDLQRKFQDQVNENKNLKDKVQKLEEEVEVLLYQQQQDHIDVNLNAMRTNRVKKDTDWYQRIQASSGGVYIRWGHDDCPATARKVYGGFAVGSYWNNTGGGGNYLCFPETPTYSTTTSALDGNRAHLYGVEYEIPDFPPLSKVHEHDTPCAVCQAMRRSNVLMVPARNDCPGGWSREYYGYLMSSRYAHKRTEFVCVDYNLKVRPGTAGDNGGSNLYPTEGRCSSSGGGIPCGPYVSGKEITCSVCTK